MKALAQDVGQWDLSAPVLLLAHNCLANLYYARVQIHHYM